MSNALRTNELCRIAARNLPRAAATAPLVREQQWSLAILDDLERLLHVPEAKLVRQGVEPESTPAAGFRP